MRGTAHPRSPVILALLLACPPAADDSATKTDSGTALFPSCRTTADCTDGSSCYAPGACNVGDYTDPPELCATSGDCGSDLVCQPVPASCGVGASSDCVESCVTRGCGATERCDTTTGVCGAWSCEEGFTCPAHTSCVGIAAGGDDNGCARDTCTVDAECGVDAWCVETRCYDALGTCTFAVP